MLSSGTAVRVTQVGAVAALLGVLTACSSGTKSTGTTPSTSTPSTTVAGSLSTSVAGPSSTTVGSDAAATTASSTSTASASPCSPTPAVIAAAAAFKEVTKVSLIGGCGEISAATTLPPGALGSPSVTRALAICTALTKVGYAGSVYGVTVGGKDGHELAASTKDQRQCI